MNYKNTSGFTYFPLYPIGCGITHKYEEGTLLRYLLDLSLYQIQIFIKSAEFKNFTATASFFNTTQSAVSKSIASMESILGFPLFIRNRSKLELTAPGEYLYQEWCGLMPHMESSVVKANMLYEHSLQTLTVGVPDSMENGSQIEYIDHFKELFPEVRLVYHVVPSNQLLPRLETGELDLIVTGIYEKRSLERLGAHYKVYMNLPETVIMHKDNPLAQRENIFMEDLKDEEFIVLSPTDNTSYFERVYLLCSKYGFRPNIELFMPNFRSMIVNLIQTKRGVVLTNQLITDAHHPDLRNFQISGTDAGMLVAWKQENTNKYLSKLLELFPNLDEPSNPPTEDTETVSL